MTAAVGTNVGLACSDVTENTYVLLLVWKCRGQCVRNGKDETLVKFTRGRGVTEMKASRFVLDEETFDLNLTGVTDEDAGQYFCVVNNKENVRERTQLKVIGSKMFPCLQTLTECPCFSTTKSSLPAPGDRIYFKKCITVMDKTSPQSQLSWGNYRLPHICQVRISVIRKRKKTGTNFNISPYFPVGKM